MGSRRKACASGTRAIACWMCAVRSASICFDSSARWWIVRPKRQLLQIMNGATVNAASVSDTFRDKRMAVMTVSVTAATAVPIVTSMTPHGPNASVVRR